MKASLWLVLAAAPMLMAEGEKCESCHEIAPTVKRWRMSSHRNVACEKCHGGTFQAANLNRLLTHARGTVPEQIRMRFVQVKEIIERCKDCHQQQFAEWSSGPHGSATYSKIFVDQKHNSTRLLMDDCLRCHGMFFEGSIGAVVSPISTTGPWKLSQPGLAKMSTIPCLACHSVHTDGEPYRAGLKRGHTPSLGLWDRRSGEHLRVADLPMPAVYEGPRAIKMSTDQRQVLCYQCHAPLATNQAWSGDDRTPIGVHEGLSCLACHSRHGQDTRASCATCHPRLSNCGLDVEKMDTTFASAKSRHNIHTVKCVDCHEKGVPKKKIALSGR